MQEYVGTVVPGKKQARELGYPTANLSYTSDTAPEHGVWACRAMSDGTTYNALAVIGMWELENGLPSLEVHLLDFNSNLYERELRVELDEKLRDLLPFSDMEALKKQIAQDITLAKETLS